MKKTRILRALKKCNSKEFIADRVLSFRDEKNKEYFDIALGINGESGDEQKENSGESISSSFRTTKW